LDYAFGETEEEEEKLESERLKCHLNLAAVCLESGHYKEAINQCRLVLLIDHENSKAVFRRGIAHLKLGDLEDAQKDLYKAMKLVSLEDRSTLRTIESSIRELNVKWRDYKRRASEMAVNAFSKHS